MDSFFKLGRFFFGIPMVIFGIQHFIYIDFVQELVPAWIPGRSFWAYLTGAALIAAGLAILLRRRVRLAAALLGTMLLLFAFLVHLPIAIGTPDDATQWTYPFQALAMSGIAFVMAGTLRKESWTLNETRDPFIRLGGFFFGVSMLVFGIRQLFLIDFIAGIAPSWIPGRPSWSYFIGAVLIVAGVAVILTKQLKLATTGLGIMLFMLFLFLYVPTVAGDYHNGQKWTNAGKVLAMCGGALAIAGTSIRSRREMV